MATVFRYVKDTPEMMEMCFNCTAPKCYDCLAGGSPRNADSDGDIRRGRPKIKPKELKELYEACKGLHESGMILPQIAEELGVNFHTLGRRLTLYRNLCRRNNVEVADFKKPGRPQKWTPEKLKSFYCEAQVLRDLGYTWERIGMEYGIRAPQAYSLHKKYEESIKEG